MSESGKDLEGFLDTNPLALDVLGFLSQSSGMTVSDLATKLGKMHPSISRSVSKLVERGLVEGTESGRKTIYKVNPREEKVIRDIVLQYTRKSARGGSVPPEFLVLLEKNNFRQRLISALEEKFGKRYEISGETVVAGRYLDHKFDILLGVQKKRIVIEVAHASRKEHLLQMLGSWSDLHGTDVDLIVLVVLGVMEQPYRSFFPSVGKEHRPPVATLLVSLPVGVGLELPAKTVVRAISSWLNKPTINSITG